MEHFMVASAPTHIPSPTGTTWLLPMDMAILEPFLTAYRIDTGFEIAQEAKIVIHKAMTSG
jgi:hypothetical protein